METVEYMQQVEQLAEEVLMDQRLLVDYQRCHNDNRVAAHGLRKLNDKKVWVNLGDLFIRMPKTDATSMIQQEQVQLDRMIQETRDSVRGKTEKLEQLERGPDNHRLHGFDLQPIAASDLYELTGGMSGDGRRHS